MWKEEAENTTSPFKDAENYSDILYGTSYWLGSPAKDWTNRACVVDGESEHLLDSWVYDAVNHDSGLRPVIKILKSNV